MTLLLVYLFPVGVMCVLLFRFGAVCAVFAELGGSYCVGCYC